MPLEQLDISKMIDSDELAAEILTQALRENDTDVLLLALSNIAKAKGMSKLARETGLSREALYKALRPGASPRFDTVMRVIKSLGVELAARPACPAA